MFGLTEDQKSLRAMVRSFADEVVEPGAEERDRTGEFPLEIVKKMGELGLLGLPFPEDVGGTACACCPNLLD